MAYHTVFYLFLFLPMVLIAYQKMPRQHRWKALLCFSGMFFMMISGWLIVYFVMATLLTYGAGLLLQRRAHCWILVGATICLLAFPVAVRIWDVCFADPLVVPVGVSFYTLEAIGYLADVYRGNVTSQKNPAKLGLFFGFFPKLMEGPICTYEELQKQLLAGEPLKAQNLSRGVSRMLWGLFKKLLIADRLSVVVGELFHHSNRYSGVMVAVAAIAYTTQLYMEFSGCMDLVIGSGQLFGISLPENFSQPFCAKSAAEFWRRWHITLGRWLKTYIFYPASMSGLVRKLQRHGKKHVGKHLTKVGVSLLTLFPVWLCNGFWHGMGSNYFFYGMYYFVLICLGILTEPFWTKMRLALVGKERVWWWEALRLLKTWCMIFVGELFFRAEGFRQGYTMFCALFQKFQVAQLWDGTLLELGVDREDIIVVLIGIFLVAVVGQIQEKKGNIWEWLELRCTPLRWSVYYGVVLLIIIFGAYGYGYRPVDLIYAGF